MLLADVKVTMLHFGDYNIPTNRDIPQMHKVILETAVGCGLYNSMSICETPIINVAPVIANAI